MKKTLLILAACLFCTVRAGAQEAPVSTVHPDSSGWENLFSQDLSDAICPKGVWSFEDGVLTATEDKSIYSKKQYKDCIVDLEFKTAPGTNSGVFVYCSDLKKPATHKVEIQIADDFAEKWAKEPATWHSGAIFGRKAPTKSLVKKPGEWNRMTITCKGPIIDVALNGEKVNEIDMRKWTSAKKNPDGSSIPPWLSVPLAELPTKGHIALQGKHADATIYFRNVKIKSLD